MRCREILFSLAALVLASNSVIANDNDLLGLFQDAVTQNRSDRVSQMLKAGTSPNQMMPNGDTALTYAIRADEPSVVKALISNNEIDVNQANIHGETPLMMAAFKGNIPLVEDFIARGAKINKKTGWTALTYAATQGHDEIVKKLLALGADPNVQTDAGITALYMAARKPSRQVVMTLLRAGAYRDLCSDRGLSPADAALRAGDKDLAQYLKIEKCAVKGPRQH